MVFMPDSQIMFLVFYKNQPKRLLDRFLLVAWNFLNRIFLEMHADGQVKTKAKLKWLLWKKYSVRGFLCSSPTSKIFKYCVLKMIPDFTPIPLLWNKILKWRSYSDLLFLEGFVSNKITTVLLPTEEGCG